MRFVLHTNTEVAEDMIDGHLQRIPPNELFEVPEIRGTDCNNNGPFEYMIPDHQVMNHLLNHLWYHGLVEVPMVKTKGGVTSDMEAAIVKAKIALKTAEDTILNKYVMDQQERISKEGKPAMAPGGRVLAIIEKRGIDLKKEYNIDPPAFHTSKKNNQEEEMNALRAQVAEQKKMFEALLSKLENNKK